MNTKLAVILSSVMIILMTGCLDDDETPINTQNAISQLVTTSAQPDNKNLTGMDIKNLLEKQELNLTLAGNSDDYILNGIKSENYYFSCSPTADCKKQLEYGISIYTFKSPQEREKGFENFNKQRKKIKSINVPIVWAKANTLILYWYNGTPLDQKPPYEDKITKALNG